MLFCATVCAMAIGGAAERGRLVALVPFCFVGVGVPGETMLVEREAPLR